MPGIIIQIHAHVPTVKSTPTTGTIIVGITPVRDYVTPSVVVSAINLALLVTFMKIIT